MISNANRLTGKPGDFKRGGVLYAARYVSKRLLRRPIIHRN